MLHDVAVWLTHAGKTVRPSAGQVNLPSNVPTMSVCRHTARSSVGQLGGVLLACCLGQPLLGEDLHDLDYLTQTPRRGELVAIYEQALSSGFSMAGYQGTWTRADRIGGEIRIAPEGDTWSPWGGLQVAQENLKGDFDVGGSVSSSTTFFDLIGGGLVHVMPENSRSFFDPGLVIFGRAGVGFQNGSVNNLETGSGPESGTLPDLRYEFGLGTEIEVCIARRLVLSGGVGINWNFANQSTIIVSNNGNTATSIQAVYTGALPYGRLGLGFRF